MKQGTRRLLKFTIRWLVSAGILYFVLRQIDLSALKKLAFQGRIWLVVPAMLFFVFSKMLSAFRLNIFFRAQLMHIPEKMNLQLYWMGMFYNLFLPGGIGGDGYKIYFLNKNLGFSVRRTFLAVLTDRITGLIALLFLCLIFLMFIKPTFINRWMISGAVVLVVLLFYGTIYRWFRSFFDVLNITNLQSLGVQLLQVFAAWFLLKALGHNGEMVSYLFVFLLSSVVAVIPITIGGMGAREATFLIASGWLGLDPAVSVALSLLFFLITTAVSLWGIVYTLVPEKITARQVH